MALLTAHKSATCTVRRTGRRVVPRHASIVRPFQTDSASTGLADGIRSQLIVVLPNFAGVQKLPNDQSTK